MKKVTDRRMMRQTVTFSRLSSFTHMWIHTLTYTYCIVQLTVGGFILVCVTLVVVKYMVCQTRPVSEQETECVDCFFA